VKVFIEENVLQRTDAKSADAVADLIDADQSAGTDPATVVDFDWGKVPTLTRSE